jgi:presenilin-like A22 family membrane protease
MATNKQAGAGLSTVIGGLIGIMMLFMMVGMMQATPGPSLPYCCPYCGQCFATYDELVAHVQAQHPGERIPIKIAWI